MPIRVAAQSDSTLYGYAWSDTIGWLSFSCDQSQLSGSALDNTCSSVEYGVSVDAAGNFSGYAWSEAIGWVSFNPADVTGCPSGSCNPVINKQTGAVSGWSKALSADGNGWDGWIKLSDNNLWTPGVSFSGNAASGYAWGSDVVGWLSWGGSGYGVYSNSESLLNEAPTAEITAPESGITTYTALSLYFGGAGSDEEDGTVAAANFKWYTTNNCTGTVYQEGVREFTRTYSSVGTYYMSLQVSDSQDALSNCDSVTIAVDVPPEIDGVCGPKAASSAQEPTDPGLCSSGTVLDPPGVRGNGPWNWTCRGENGGASAQCQADNSCGAQGADAACQPQKGETPLTCPSDCRLQFKEF